MDHERGMEMDKNNTEQTTNPNVTVNKKDSAEYTIEYCQKEIERNRGKKLSVRGIFRELRNQKRKYRQSKRDSRQDGTQNRAMKRPTLMRVYKTEKKAQVWRIEGTQDWFEYKLMCDNVIKLRELVNEDPSKKEFVAFYEKALTGAFHRYRHSKVQTWGLLANWLETLLGSVLAALTLVVADVVVLMLGSTNTAGNENVLPLRISVIGIAFLVAHAYVEWRKKKNDKETWVRHSSCFSRLSLLVQRYLLSDKTDKDYQAFVESTFAILEQNLDQFVLNLSANGMAERAEVNWQKTESEQEEKTGMLSMIKELIGK